MKKYILKAAFFALALGTLVSCDEDIVTYGGQNFVTFDRVASTRLIALEDKGDSATPVNLAFPLSHDLTITFDINPGVAVEGVDYTLPSNTITIPAGETTANFVIHAIDNTITNDSKVIEITISAVSDASVKIGTNDIGSPYKRLVLLNEDCTTRFSDLLGKYNVKDGDDLVGTAEVDINDTGDCNILRISGVVDNILNLETDTYIEVELVPGVGSTAKTRGTLKGYQQLLCAECFVNSSNNGINETWVFTPSGTFNTTQDGGTIVLNGTMSTASGFYTDIASSVTLVRPASN